VCGCGATADGCAIVRKISDGFLNLRQSPTMKALAIAKLKPGWMLSIDDAQCEQNGAISICGTNGEWTHINAMWPIDEGPDGGTFTKGWVATRYIKFLECPD
jgi:SH3-like domain-containing protein